MKIKKGDKVKVTTGKYEGTIGAVLEVRTKKNQVLIDGVNVKKRAVKHSESNTESYTYIQHPINASNVRLVDENNKYLKKREEQKVTKKEAPKKSKVEKGEKKTESKTKSKRSSK